MISFHWEGLLISFAILIPNILVIAFPPVDYPAAVKLKGWLKAAEIFERLGQIGYTLVPLLVYTNFKGVIGTVSYIGMALALTFYYSCWLRFFTGKRRFKLLFSPLWNIPIPMAISPIMYMGFASVGMNSWIMGLTVLVFSIGHLPISYGTSLKSK